MYQLLIVFIIFISTLFATETELKKTPIFIECHFCNEDFIKKRITFSEKKPHQITNLIWLSMNFLFYKSCLNQ